MKAELAVDEIVDPVGQVGEDFRLLCLGQSPVLHGLSEVGLRGRDQGGLQPVDRLALRRCDLGERVDPSLRLVFSSASVMPR